jgi:hypothetical protein
MHRPIALPFSETYPIGVPMHNDENIYNLYRKYMLPFLKLWSRKAISLSETALPGKLDEIKGILICN